MFVVFFLIVSLLIINPAFSSEITNLTAENDLMFIHVAKGYPEVRFSQFQNPHKVLLELLDTTYHPNFSFNERIKKNLLNGLSFIHDASIGVARYEGEKNKVGIILKLNNEASIIPNIVSKKDSVIKISFLNKESNKKDAKKEVTQDTYTLEKEITNLYNKAVEEHSKNNLNEAEKLYKEIISKDNHFYLARFNLSKLYIDKDLYDESISILRKLIHQLPASQEATNNKNLILAHNTLGIAYYLKGNLSEALEEIHKALDLDLNNYQAYYNIGLIYEKIKDIKNAKLNFQKAVELCTSEVDLANIYYHLSVLNLITNDKEVAISGFKKVVELLPDSKLAKLSEDELKKLERKTNKFFKRK